MKVDIGKSGVRPQDAYDNTKAYEKNDIVYKDGSGYIAKKAVPIGAAFTNEYWMLFARGIDAFVTPEMFGAKGDGVADDTDAVQSAMAEGLDVLLCGTYLISRGIEPKSNIRIYGGGTLKGSSTLSADLLLMKGSNTSGAEAHHITIEDITIIANSNYCVQIYGQGYTNKPHDIQILNVKTQNGGTGGVFVNSGHDITVKGLKHSGGYRAVGVMSPIASPTDANNIYIADCESKETTQFGIQTYYSTDISITGNIIDGSLETGGDESCITVDRSVRVNVSGNICMNAPLSNIFVTGATDVIVTNNLTKGGQYGIQSAQNNEYYTEDNTILECKNITISNNNCKGASTKSILISGNKNCVVLGNVCDGGLYSMNGTVSGGGSSVITDSENISFISNIASGMQNANISKRTIYIGNVFASPIVGLNTGEDIVIDGANVTLPNTVINLNSQLKYLNRGDTGALYEWQLASEASHYGMVAKYNYGTFVLADTHGNNAFAFRVGQNKAVGDLLIMGKGKGVSLVSPDGNTTKRLTIDNSGNIALL